MSKKAIVGINPRTARCEIIATDASENWEECRANGLIVVPTTIDVARFVWGEVVGDVYALAAGGCAPRNDKDGK